MAYSPIGLSKWDLDTPALLIDLDILEQNITPDDVSFRILVAGIP